MTTYVSKSVKGFFDDEISGAPVIKIEDPSWQRPTVSVDIHPGETYGDVVNDGSEVMQISVPDENAIAPIVEVANPACRLPKDAVAITDEYKAVLLNAKFGINWDVSPPAPAAQPMVTPAESWETFKRKAVAAMAASDSEFDIEVEYLMAGQSASANAESLVKFRQKLRAIINAPSGTPDESLLVRTST